MLKFFKNKLKKNIEIFGLILLVLITGISTSYFNYEKKLNNETYNSIVNNIYFKKTLNNIIDNLDPKNLNIKLNQERLLIKF